MKERPMFEKILLPLDGSRTAETILSQAYRILKRRDSEVIILRVIEGPESSTSSIQPGTRAQAEEYVRGLEVRLRESGVQARGVVEHGAAAEAILQAAARQGATMIAMATHGRTGLARWTFGSVAEKVLRASSLPVLVVRAFRPDQGSRGLPPVVEEELSIRRVLVPLDMSRLSMEVLPYVIEVAQVFSSKVLLLHVLEDFLTQPLPELREAADQFLKRGLQVEPILGKGDPASQILDLCGENAADLIAMTTHGRSGPSRWVLGSVTEKVLRAASVPLLVVRGAMSKAIVG